MESERLLNDQAGQCRVAPLRAFRTSLHFAVFTFTAIKPLSSPTQALLPGPLRPCTSPTSPSPASPAALPAAQPPSPPAQFRPVPAWLVVKPKSSPEQALLPGPLLRQAIFSSYSPFALPPSPCTSWPPSPSAQLRPAPLAAAPQAGRTLCSEYLLRQAGSRPQAGSSETSHYAAHSRASSLNNTCTGSLTGINSTST